MASNTVLIWIFNFIFIYVTLYRRGYQFVAGFFIAINALLVFQILESNISRLAIFVGMLIAIITSLGILKMISARGYRT